MNELLTENLLLRKFETGDADDFVVAILESEKTVGEWLPWWKADYSRNEALEWFQSCADGIDARTAFSMGIFRKDDGLLVGIVTINRIDAQNCIGSFGYWVRETQQANGYCTEAVSRMAAFGFDELKLARLEIVALVENKASRLVAEKCGAELECIAKNRLVHKGQPSAAAIYALTRQVQKT